MPIDVATSFMPWATLVALGAFHGINPGMGWLFAVALGMQDRRRSAVVRALVPLAAGHALAVTGAVAAALAIGAVVPTSWLRYRDCPWRRAHGCTRVHRRAGLLETRRGNTAPRLDNLDVIWSAALIATAR